MAYLIVTTTVASREHGRTIARALVEARLAACVQILPIQSIYRWEGAVEEADEHLLLCKIREADYGSAEATIRDRHSYDVPEIVAVPIVAGSRPYLAWIEDSTAR